MNTVLFKVILVIKININFNKFQLHYDCNGSPRVRSGSRMIHVIAMCIESQHKHTFVEKGKIKKNIHNTDVRVLSYMQSLSYNVSKNGSSAVLER